MTTVVAPLALFSPGRTYSNLFLYFSSCLPPPLFNNVAISKKKSTRAPSSLSVLHMANGAATSRRLDVDVDVDVDDEEDEDGTRSENYLREDYLVKKVSAKDVHDLLKGGKTTVPLIVDFYATWCGPCILMAQDLELLAVEYETSALFVKVDTDEEHEFARNMQVRGLPTLYFFSPDPNKDAIRTEGLVPPEMIKNIIDNEM